MQVIMKPLLQALLGIAFLCFNTSLSTCSGHNGVLSPGTPHKFANLNRVDRARNTRGSGFKTLNGVDRAKTGLEDVTHLYISPNPYEFLACLKGIEKIPQPPLRYYDKLSKKISKDFYDREQLTEWQKAVRDRIVPPIMVFMIKEQIIAKGKPIIKNKIICLAWSGEGPIPTTNFCQKIKEQFKNLKQVFVCGICGCSNPKVDFGTLCISKHLMYIERFSLGTPHDEELNFAFKTDSFFCRKRYIKSFSVSNFSFISAHLARIASLAGIDHCDSVNISGPIFFGHPTTTAQLAKLAKEKHDCDTCAFNMEDGIFSQSFPQALLLRFVSDHGDSASDGISGPGKNIALDSLTRAVTVSITNRHF